MKERPRGPQGPIPAPPPLAAKAAPNARRALSHVGGRTVIAGDPKAGALLAAALDVPTSDQAEEAARAHVHGFHAYPARMHPLTARRLVEGFSTAGDSVLDPFCGSGTVLVEARLAGRRAVGVDANPLAVRLAELKARGSDEASRGRLLEGAKSVAAIADERRKAKSGPSHRYGHEDVELFESHVLLELDGLRLGLDALQDVALRSDLELVFSAILNKVSRRASDTSDRSLARRIAAGYPARLLVKKTEELTRLLAEVAPELAKSPPATVREGDARELRGVADGSIALAVTSPPYPGVYDYLAHHAARLRWLRLSAQGFDRAEVGARRRLDPLGPRRGRERWSEELGSVLAAMSRVLVSGGSAILLIADSVVAGAPIRADDVLAAVAPTVSLKIVATASQDRPHFHGPTMRAFSDRPRREHAILLVRTAKETPRPRPNRR